MALTHHLWPHTHIHTYEQRDKNSSLNWFCIVVRSSCLPVISIGRGLFSGGFRIANIHYVVRWRSNENESMSIRQQWRKNNFIFTVLYNALNNISIVFVPMQNSATSCSDEQKVSCAYIIVVFCETRHRWSFKNIYRFFIGISFRWMIFVDRKATQFIMPEGSDRSMDFVENPCIIDIAAPEKKVWLTKLPKIQFGWQRDTEPNEIEIDGF